MTDLISNKGTVKTAKEWQSECTKDYAELNINLPDQWERYQRVLGLRPVGSAATGRIRKPVKAQREGLTSWGYEHD